MKITNINRQAHHLLSDAVKKALAQVEADFGVTFTPAGGHLGMMKGDIRLNVEVVPVAGTKSAAQIEFEMYAGRIGLLPSDFGRVFRSSHSGRRFKINGVLLGGRKYDMSAEELGTGKSFKFIARGIAHQLRMEDKVAA